MIICDRCQAAAMEKVTFESDDQRFDLCVSCRHVVLEVLTGKPGVEPINMDEKPSDENRRKRRNKE